jgi:3',5'-nucleoside bisphosphate phosphatase
LRRSGDDSAAHRAGALEKQIDLIAITDHNASANVAPSKSRPGHGLTVLPGMEVQSREDVHLCLFETSNNLNAWQKKWMPPCPTCPTMPDFLASNLSWMKQVNSSAASRACC